MLSQNVLLPVSAADKTGHLGLTRVNDISALGNCTNLQRLGLSRATLTDVSVLCNYKNVRTLNLARCNNLSDIVLLGNCAKLVILNYGT